MIYRLLFAIYVFVFRIVALFHRKAALMVKGHREVWKKLQTLDSSKPCWWFHASSLGEFEQGRPLMEAVREQHPEYSILLTFYSPSGYEVRKQYAGADVVCYLPFDTPRNVRRFLKEAKPARAFFIKYEFWPNYLKALKKQNIPTCLVSGIFRENQPFFKPYGVFYRHLLACFDALFVQNEQSVALLSSVGITEKVYRIGDTRCDRVLDIASKASKLPLLETFASCASQREEKKLDGKTTKVWVAGSSWPKDEELLIPYFNTHPEWKLILAPHRIHEEHLKWIENKLERPFVRYSALNEENVRTVDCIIVDCFGLLSSIYRYGHLAYVGGGFGVGIHNVLEAAVYGIPVLFGPNYEKFDEAKALLACGGAFSINDEKDLCMRMDEIGYSEAESALAGKSAAAYVQEGSGATKAILTYLAKLGKAGLSLLALVLTCSANLFSQEQLVLQSEYLGCNDTCMVYTPQQHAGEEMPTLILLHGWSGSFRNFGDHYDMQELCNRTGFRIICPDGFYNSWYLNDMDKDKMQYRTFWNEEFMPKMRELYRIKPENTFIDGLSMGGHGALNIYFDHPEYYRSAGSMSGVLDLHASKLADKWISKVIGPYTKDNERFTSESAMYRLEQYKAAYPQAGEKWIVVSCGHEDRYAACALEFCEKCKEWGVPHYLVLSSGNHTWNYWEFALENHLWLFRRILDGHTLGKQ